MAILKTVNIKSDRPTVDEALERLDREIWRARQQNHILLKVIHGYGSTGAGGDIRIAVQKRLQERVAAGQIAGCIFGEEWAKSSEQVWRMLEAHPELKPDPDLGRQNLGITIVVL
jgi:hypothetical protein